MESLLVPAYRGAVALYGLALVLGLMGRTGLERAALLAALAANCAALGLIVALSGHLPACAGFESFLLAALPVGLGALLAPGREGAAVRRGLLTLVLAVLALALLFPQVPEPYRYYFGESDVTAFFVCRLLALSAMLYATGNYLAFAAARKGERPTRLYERGHRFLLLGVLLFLVSEYAGCRWLWRGWGDFWSWNANFLEGALVLLYAMLATHLPARWATLRGRAWAGALAGPLLAVSFVLHYI